MHSSRMHTAIHFYHTLGVSVHGSLCPGESLSRGVSVQGGLCPEESLSRGVSIQWGLCPGGSLSRGVSVWEVSVRETPFPCEQTDACENIILGGNKFSLGLSSFEGNAFSHVCPSFCPWGVVSDHYP